MILHIRGFHSPSVGLITGLNPFLISSTICTEEAHAVVFHLLIAVYRGSFDALVAYGTANFLSPVHRSKLKAPVQVKHIHATLVLL